VNTKPTPMPLDQGDAVLNLKTAPARFSRFWTALSLFTSALSTFLVGIGAILGVFILHQLFFWASSDPESAFDTATYFLQVVETWWDMVALVWNPLIDIANTALIPLWNGAVFYIFEPIVFLVLEAFSLVFLRRKYGGIISDDALPYGGFECDPGDQASMAWCGRASAYDARLAGSGSQSAENSIVIGADTARRLSETQGLDFDVPAFDASELVGALDGLATQAIVMVGALCDLLFAVLYNIIETTVVFLFDAAFVIVKSVFDILKLVVKSGLLQTILEIGLDFLLIMIIEIGVPLLTAAIDALMCVLSFFNFNSWSQQLRCAELECFRGPDATSDWFIFTSIPQVTQRFGAILEATLNSNTGRSFSGGQSFDLGVSDFGEIFPSLNGNGCADCFSCKFPELRFLWFVSAVVTALFNPDNFEAFKGNVSHNCMTNGSFYDELCGPRGAEKLPFEQWARLYPNGFRYFDINIVEAYAAKMEERSKELSGSASGFEAHDAAMAWLKRDPNPGWWDRLTSGDLEAYRTPEEVMAGPFHWRMCRIWRSTDAGSQSDVQPAAYGDYATDSLSHITSKWAFDTCRRYKHEVFGSISRSLHDTALVWTMCFEDRVECKKDFELCLGTCAGDSTSNIKHDFNTMVALSDLNSEVLGEDGFLSAHANCTTQTTTIEVFLFEGGDSFQRFAAETRVRSGATALPNAFCEQNPLSCSIIVKALERAPGLRFVPGVGWRHAYSMAPPAPPPPPPSFQTRISYGPVPPGPSPPPQNPPPYYNLAEPCTPLPTPAFFGGGLDLERENADSTFTEDRAACVFTKRLTEKRKPASNCFASILPPSPPPPPPSTVKSAMDALDANRQRFVRGDKAAYEPGILSENDEYLRELDETAAATQALIGQLGENNPILKRIMNGAVTEMRSAASQAELSSAAAATVTDSGTYGRRLMVRQFDYATSMADALISHPIMDQLKTGIPGVTNGVCESLCEAINVDTNITDSTNCRAFAHKRSNPFSLTDLSGRCFLLKSAGSCKPEDFAAGLLTRHVQSEDICHNPQPGLADELCVQLPTTRYALA
jgi:hypothetical protein